MRYGSNYVVIEFESSTVDKIQDVIENRKWNFKESLISNKNSNEISADRLSKQAWIKDPKFLKYFLDIEKEINSICSWNLDITGIEPIQYGIYEKGNKYDWHVDQHPKPINGIVRKISMSFFLNSPEDYEGGEFDLEIHKPNSQIRYETFKLKKGSAIFFLSHYWHRVRPIRSGVRKSLVAWYTGPPFK
tara:strand:- start:341 stop:907 length:567 start_codon:yes stop_codon:yes gene_type:complete